MILLYLIFIKEPTPNIWKVLKKLSRQEIRIITGLITGHNTLQKHLVKMKLADFDWPYWEQCLFRRRWRNISSMQSEAGGAWLQANWAGATWAALCRHNWKTKISWVNPVGNTMPKGRYYLLHIVYQYNFLLFPC